LKTGKLEAEMRRKFGCRPQRFGKKVAFPVKASPRSFVDCWADLTPKKSIELSHFAHGGISLAELKKHDLNAIIGKFNSINARERSAELR